MGTKRQIVGGQKSEPQKLEATSHLKPETQYSNIPLFQLSRFVSVAKTIFYDIA